MAVTMKNAIFGMLHHVALVRPGVLEVRIASFIIRSNQQPKHAAKKYSVCACVCAHLLASVSSHHALFGC
jgi:hypothetical protein